MAEREQDTTVNANGKRQAIIDEIDTLAGERQKLAKITVPPPPSGGGDKDKDDENTAEAGEINAIQQTAEAQQWKLFDGTNHNKPHLNKPDTGMFFVLHEHKTTNGIRINAYEHMGEMDWSSPADIAALETWRAQFIPRRSVSRNADQPRIPWSQEEVDSLLAIIKSKYQRLGEKKVDWAVVAAEHNKLFKGKVQDMGTNLARQSTSKGAPIRVRGLKKGRTLEARSELAIMLYIRRLPEFTAIFSPYGPQKLHSQTIGQEQRPKRGGSTIADSELVESGDGFNESVEVSQPSRRRLHM